MSGRYKPYNVCYRHSRTFLHFPIHANQDGHVAPADKCLIEQEKIEKIEEFNKVFRYYAWIQYVDETLQEWDQKSRIRGIISKSMNKELVDAGRCLLVIRQEKMHALLTKELFEYDEELRKKGITIGQERF